MKHKEQILHSFFSTLKGDRGEKQVRLLLEKHNYICMHDILLQRPNQNPVQIDHLVLTANGIYVLETKHYQGHICGYLSGQNWQQSFPSNDQPRLLPNAFKQNNFHCEVLRKKLGKANFIPINSLIIFTGSCTVSGNISSRIISLEQLPKILGKSKVTKQFEDIWHILQQLIKQENGNFQKMAFQISFLS